MSVATGAHSRLHVATPLNIQFLKQFLTDEERSWTTFLPDSDSSSKEQFAKCSVYWTSLNFPVNDVVLTRFPNLRYIITPTTGLTHIDLSSATLKTISVISLKGQNLFLNSITATAEHAWGLMISLWRKTFLANSLRSYQPQRREDYSSLQLKGRTVGIIGYGRIGKQLAAYSVAFGLNVVVFDKYLNLKSEAKESNLVFLDSLKEMPAKIDILFVCAAVVDADRQDYPLLTETFLKECKNHLVLVNTARGMLLDEKAAGKALEEGLIGGLGLDVLQVEDLPDMNDNSRYLFELKDRGFNIAITPHIGGMCQDAFESAFQHVWKLFQLTNGRK
jgi:D-3-phosphoglycerate dehydrogenase